MRTKLAILAGASCLLLCAQPASLEGTAVEAVTQSPLAGVHVSLISLGAGTNLPEPDDAYGAISDAGGHYSIGNIRPGTYIFDPKRTAYVYLREKDVAATPTITLKAGEPDTGYRIAMTAATTITGRVVDEFGDPMQGVGVRVVSVDDPAPYGLWAMRSETDDRGEYRISGLPGKYYVEADVPPLRTGGTPEIRTDGSSTTAYATTYYPGALAKERGKVVEAGAGQELTGIDIHVAHRKSLTVSGVVSGIPAAGPNGGSVRATVTIRVSHDGGEAEDSDYAAANGSFAFVGLAPGEYHVRATYPGGAGGSNPLRSPSVPVTIENDDATVNLAVSAGEAMAGTLQIEGSAAIQSATEKWTIHLTPVDPDGTPTSQGQVANDGSFLIGGIIPGKYLATVDPLPENAYVRSVLFGGAEAAGGQLDLSNGVRGATLKLTVSRNGGQASGMITDKDGHRLIGRHLIVVLAADPNSFPTWRTAASSDATFAFHGIRPGKYRLFVIDPMQFGGAHSYDAFKTLAAQAEEFEVNDGDRAAKDLHVAGKDDPGAK